MIVAAIAASPGCAWGPVEAQLGPSGKERRVELPRDRLLAERKIVNVGTENGRKVALDHCQQGVTAHLFPADHPEVAQLARDSGPVRASASPLWAAGEEEGSGAPPEHHQGGGSMPTPTPPPKRVRKARGD